MPSDHLTRRSLLQGSAAVAAAAPTLASAGAATARPTAKGETGMIPVELTVNGREVHLQVDPRTTLDRKSVV